MGEINGVTDCSGPLMSIGWSDSRTPIAMQSVGKVGSGQV